MPRQLPVSGGSGPQEPPAYGGLGENGWSRGRTFLELTAAAGAARVGLEAAFDAVALPAPLRDFFADYARAVRVLALADLGQTDTLVNVAQAERLFSLGKRIWMRVFTAPEHPDLVQLFRAVELPLLVFFAADKREFARWGPCPRALASLHTQDQDPEEVRRDFYNRSRGVDLAMELRALLDA